MNPNPSQVRKEAVPKYRDGAAGSKKNPSLKVLCSQIEQAIQSLKGKEDGQRIITSINEKNVLDESTYATRLFESYSAIVSAQPKEASKQSEKAVGTGSSGSSSPPSPSPSSKGEEMTDLDDIEFMREVPDYLYQGTGKQIAGWDALKRNIFWIRLAMMFFCVISFSVMDSLPYIRFSKVTSEMLLSDCREQSQYGEFSYRSYRFVSSAAFWTWLYALIFCLYYLIPVDAQERKYIPSSPLYLLPLRWEKRVLFSRKASSRYLEVFLDAFLLVLCLSAAISAAVSIDHSEAFHSEAVWTRECVYGACDAAIGGCMNEYSYCEGCDGVHCSDGSCANPEGVCEGECVEALRCLDGTCPNENGVCDYGPDAMITTHTRTGPDAVYYSLHTFVNTYDAISARCIDHDPLAIIKASLSFLFLAVILLLIALQISLRSLYLEKVKSDVLSGKKSLPLSDDSAHDEKA